MILSGETILERLRAGQIFREGSWDEASIREASYALRLANDGLLVSGEFYEPGVPYTGSYISIKPGEIAILSTVERLNMPDDLLGKIGLRLDAALKGLVGLMGIQVDPLYGQDQEDERLYIRVANFGNETVKFLPGEHVFTFELHEVSGIVRLPSPPKTPTWSRLKRQLASQDDSSWSYVTQVQSETVQVEGRLRAEINNIKDYLQPLVMFGIFLVAVTILGVAIAVIVSVRDTPEVSVPSWVTGWGWIVLMCTLTIATATTAAIGGFSVWRLAKGK
ncbi:MAG: hypothetical protein OXD31_13655 [Chloroflexi bacterium]|nr:hypothetical protein [Chloroflexota bacterium]